MSHASLHHSHSSGLVILSIVIAILASYTALDLAGRVTAARGRAQLGWLIGGAMVMGIGIWSMHFTAMLAFKLPIPTLYNVPIVLLSLIVAIVASGIALFVASRQALKWHQLLLGGFIMGLAIAAMHYIGMAAMRVQATLQYDPILFILSIIIAILASIAALWLAFRFRGASPTAWNWLKTTSAVIMGGAISGMHYTGMSAAIFIPSDTLEVDLSRAVDISSLGAISIAGGTLIALGFTLLMSFIDQRLATQSAHLIEQELHHSQVLQKLNKELEAHIADMELIAKVNQAATTILDQQHLFAEIVEKTHSTFNYYHVHLYLLDVTSNELVVVSGTGDVGRMLLAREHKIPYGKGLVGSAAQTKHVVLAPDVFQNENWWPNPLLPDTKAEIAVPIILGQQVLGVLDVQNDVVNSLTERDANILQLIANQVAIAIRNARLFSDVKTTLTEAQAIQERYAEQSSIKIKENFQRKYYHYSRPDALPLSEVALAETKRQIFTQNRPTIVGLESPEMGLVSIAAPIIIGNQYIGTIHLQPARNDQIWTQKDLAIVEAVINQFSQMVENLRLFEETRQRASREQAIREITEKLRAAPNLDHLLETASRELAQRLGVRHTVMELGIETELQSPPVNTTKNGH